MKVGDFVRTKNCGIRKIVKIENENTSNSAFFILDKTFINNYLVYLDYVDINEIIKSSDKPMDLIEEGDYVNGFKVLEILSHSSQLIFITYRYNGHHYTKILDNEDIKSIVTHEQFEHIEYRIGEE